MWYPDPILWFRAFDALRPTARHLLLEGLRSGLATISPQVLSEFIVTMTRKVARPLSAERVRDDLVHMQMLDVIDLDPTMGAKPSSFTSDSPFRTGTR